MSVLGNLISRYGRTPVWLVEMTRGATVYRYRLGKGDFYYDGETFLESSLDFEELNYGPDIRRDDFTLDNFPLSDATTQALIAAGRIPLSITVYKGFEGVGEFIVPFIGTLSAIRFKRRSVSLVFSSWGNDLSKRSPGFVFQRQCPWRLYSDECGVSQATFTTAGTATTFSNNETTVNAALAEANGYYTGGKLIFAGEERTIEKHVSNVLTLSAGFLALAQEIDDNGSASVTIVAGCDKSLATCLGRFNNIGENGSFPAMTEDPFYRTIF